MTIQFANHNNLCKKTNKKITDYGKESKFRCIS